MIGTSLNQYQIAARLGAGGMGEALRDRDTRLSQEVAVKALPSGFASAANRLRRFDRSGGSCRGSRRCTRRQRSHNSHASHPEADVAKMRQRIARQMRVPT